MKKIKNVLISMELMLILTIIFGIASAMGTFIENDYGTETAWAAIYTTKWFELIQILLAINLIGNIFKYNLFKYEKLPILLFHSGFIIILLGAAMTRYVGYEGIMHIREGKSANFMRTRDAFVQLKAIKADKTYYNETKRYMSKISDNSFTLTVDIDGDNAILACKSVVSGGENNSTSFLLADLTYKNETKEIKIINFGQGTIGKETKASISDAEFSLAWGSKIVKLPFKIKLNDFQLDRYAGSMSPSSYASEVTLIDEKNELVKPFRIFMNNILDYKNHRFFQSSYDMDEKGTILTVNNDPGKVPTYIGYLLLTIGLMLNILNPKSRFRKLAKAIQKDTIARSSSFIFALLLASNSQLHSDSIDKEHANNFGDMLIQAHDGRIKSMDTFSNEVLLKLSKKSSLNDQTSNQVMLGMITDPRSWQDEKMIYIKHSKINNILGLGKLSKAHAKFSDFFDYSKKVPYKLASFIEEANHKNPVLRNEFDRQVIKTDERLNIAYMVYTGDLMNIVPKPKDANNKWYGVKEAVATFDKESSEVVRSLFINYFSHIDKAKKSNDWTKANEALDIINKYQRGIGKDIIPDQSKIDAEKFFKKVSLFNKLILVYLFAGIILLGVILTKMLKPKADISKISKIILSIIALAFILHTLGLAARWYIGGHAPWSNAYEAMLYVAWSMGLAGLVFARYSLIAPALTGIITGITLGSTFLTEMDPQITNLVPVLKSYWLNIHVSVITASYGFLGLSMMLGFFAMILFIFKSNNNDNIKRSIIESTRINEMTAILGLSLLTIGNFLGGVWANESWGRYWGWDPKETWAWVSVLAYVLVLHIRFIPAIKKNYEYWYSVASTLAYGVIIMTFVGVNYYLSGMHSYAAGDPVPIPQYLYVIIAVVLAVIAMSYPKRSLKK